MLAWVVGRTRYAQSVKKVVVATSTGPEDDAIAAFCETASVACFRGSQFDLLDRYYRAASAHGADVVVRVTADCPLIDPALIDRTVALLSGETPGSTADFAANRLPPPWGRTFPIGLDVEACPFPVLETAWREAESLHHREHVMPFLYEHPERFRIALLDHTEDLGALRWTVDTPEDLEAVRALAGLLPRLPARPPWEGFTWLDALEIWQRSPEISAINAGVRHKTGRETDARAGK